MPAETLAQRSARVEAEITEVRRNRLAEVKRAALLHLWPPQSNTWRVAGDGTRTRLHPWRPPPAPRAAAPRPAVAPALVAECNAEITAALVELFAKLQQAPGLDDVDRIALDEIHGRELAYWRAR